MSTIPVIFTKCFYKKNISSFLENNSKFNKIDTQDDTFEIYEYPFSDYEQFTLSDNNEIYSKFLRAKIYLIEKSFIFISTEYETEITEDDITPLGKTAYRICHGDNKVIFPDQEIVQELFKSLNSDETISFLQPDGYSVKRFDYKIDEFDKYTKPNNEGMTKIFSFIFYYYPILKEIASCNTIIQGLKNAVFGNVKNFRINAEIEEIKINDYYSMFASKTGIGLFKIKEDSIKKEINDTLYLTYLKSLKEIIYFEIKTKDFNREIDSGEYKNIDELNKSVRKEKRNAVHLKYDIKNYLLMNSIKKIFYGKYLLAVNFDETLSEFIEICHSMENELRARIDEREEKHDKYFDKILSVVGIFAIISAFKDGSDLILSFIDVLKTGQVTHFDISNVITILSPIVCLVLICVLIKIFNKKK